ncbi:unnamed protein product, partial [Scytosiphon promiscuus]
ILAILFQGIISLSNAQYLAEWASAGIGLGNNYGKEIYLDPTGNLYVVGNLFTGTVDFGNGVTVENIGINDYLIKYNQEGMAQWANLIPSDIKVKFGTEGECYVTGTYTGLEEAIGDVIPEDVDGNTEDRYIIKYSADGETEWVKLLAGSMATDS